MGGGPIAEAPQNWEVILGISEGRTRKNQKRKKKKREKKIGGEAAQVGRIPALKTSISLGIDSVQFVNLFFN